MSLLVNNCHGYKATGVTGWPASPTKAWALGWFKVDSTTGGTRRAIIQVTNDALDSTHDYFGIAIDGSNVLVANARTGNINAATPDPGNLYFWNGANQNKWTFGASVLDIASSGADLNCIFGRVAATAVAATTQTASGDMPAFVDTLVDIYIGGDMRKVANGSGTTNDSSDGIKLAYIAIGHGSVPSQADIQLVIDGMHPADLAGVFEYWDLTSSSSGLVGALTGATLAPYGGAVTTTWDGADNPIVDAPSSGGNAAPTFSGPNIGDQSGTVGVALSANTISDSFSDSDALTFSAIGSWPAGVTVSSAGVISGTPTTDGTYANLQVRATDTAAQTVDSDVFSFTISAAGTDASAAGAIVTGTGTIAAGTATGGSGATGSFTFDACKNNTETAALNGVSVNWAWHSGGVVGTAGTITTGSGTMTTAGMTVSGLPVGVGYGVFRTADGTVVGYQEGTVS